MKFIVLKQCLLIIKHGFCFLERNSMLCLIYLIFGLVPFKMHRYITSYNCIIIMT